MHGRSNPASCAVCTTGSDRTPSSGTCAARTPASSVRTGTTNRALQLRLRPSRKNRWNHRSSPKSWRFFHQRPTSQLRCFCFAPVLTYIMQCPCLVGTKWTGTTNLACPTTYYCCCILRIATTGPTTIRLCLSCLSRVWYLTSCQVWDYSSRKVRQAIKAIYFLCLAMSKLQDCGWLFLLIAILVLLLFILIGGYGGCRGAATIAAAVLVRVGSRGNRFHIGLWYR